MTAHIRIAPFLILLAGASASAEGYDCLHGGAYEYGTNRITPHTLYSLKQKVQWDGPAEIQILKTKNFEIYMGKDEEAVARRVGSIAESWYPVLEEKMGVEYDSLVGEGRPLPLIGYTSTTRFQVTNTSPGMVGEGVRGFYDLIRGRIVFPFTGSNELLGHVIRHELVHAFTVRLVERSWYDYLENRDLARSRANRWRALSYEARRMARLAPRGQFPRFVRGTLACEEDEVVLPPERFGEGFLHPRIFFGYSDEEARRPTLSVGVRFRDSREARHFASLPDTTLERLARLLPTASYETEAMIREVARPYPWVVEPGTDTLFTATADTACPEAFVAAFAAAVRRAGDDGAGAGEAAADSGGWSSTGRRIDLVRVDHLPSSELGHWYEAIAPLYHAVGAIPYAGETLPEHAVRSTGLYDDAVGRLYRWVPPDAKPRMFPIAVMEGVAEFYSSEWNDLNDLVLRDLVFHERLVPFERLSARHGYLVYVEGKSFFHWLGEQYGTGRVGIFLKSIYRGRTTGEVFEGVFGDDLPTLSERWERSVRRRYLDDFPDVRETEEYAEEASDGPYDGPPAAEGGALAYTAYRRARGRVVLRESGSRRQVASDGLPGFESLHLGSPTVALRGDAVAYVVQNRGRDEIHLYSRSAGRLTSRIRLDSLLTVESLDISPGGDELALTALEEEGGCNLHTVGADGTGLRRLTADHYHEKDVQWGGNGMLYVADRNEEGRYDLYRRSPDGSVRRLLALDRSIENPRWHGSDVLFITRRGDEARNVFLFRPEAGELTALTRDAVGIKAFDVDADTLYLLTNKELRFRIWKTSLTGLLDSARTTATVAAIPGERPWRLPEPVKAETAPYRPRYGPDIFFLTGGSFYQQSYLGLSDLLGNRKIAIFAGSDAGRSDEILKHLSAGATVHLLGGRNDYRLGLFRYANDFLTNDRGFYFREEYGALAGITHPFDRYRSIGANLLVKQVGEEPVGGGDRENFGEATVEGILGYDTTVPGPFGYGFGAGYLASLIYSVDMEFAPRREIRSGTALADLRAYFPLGGRWVWASRLSGGISDGDFPREIVIGGSLTLRGYDFLSLEGNRYYLSNQEIRFPFPLRLLVAGRDLFNPLQGAAFVDAGDTWFKSGEPTLRGSTGFGLRAGFGGAVLRWDLAKKFLRDDFHGGWESDFFIGWNF